MNIMDLAMKQLKNFSNREIRQLKVGYFDEPQFDSKIIKTHLINELAMALGFSGSCVFVDSNMPFDLPFGNTLSISLNDRLWGTEYLILNNEFEFYDEIINIFKKLFVKYNIGGYHITMTFDNWIGSIETLSAERSIHNPSFKNWEKTDVIYFESTK